MRRRCFACGAIATSKWPCKRCGAAVTMRHCHDRAHQNHAFSGGAYYPIGYKGERLEPTVDCVHTHPFDKFEHMNEPSHAV